MAGRSWLTKMIVNVNVIVEMLFDPCDAPLSVYLETLLPAVMEMLMDMYGFDVSEYQEQKPFSSMQPQGLKSASKARRGKKGGGKKRWRSILDALSSDPGEMLGKKNARDFGGKRRILTGGTSHLWILGGALQRLFFWVWFISRTGGLFYDWYMGIIAKGYCSENTAGIFVSWESEDASHGLFGWKPVLVWRNLKQRGAPAWHTSYGTSGNFECRVAVRMTAVARYEGAERILRFRIISDGPGGEEEQLFKEYRLGLDVPTNIGFAFSCPPRSSFTIEVWNNAGLVDLYDVWLHGYSRQKSLFVPWDPYVRDFRGRRVDVEAP